MFNRQHLRSVAVVFGIGEERPFYVEKAPALLMERVRHNFSFFYLNYMALTAVMFTLTLLISPTAIIGIGLLGFAWMYMIRSTTNGHIKIGGESSTYFVLDGVEMTSAISLLVDGLPAVFSHRYSAETRNYCYDYHQCLCFVLLASTSFLVDALL